MMVREAHSRLCWRLLEGQTKRVPDGRMRSSAVIFSPHYDDETLGVGGTIIQKRRAGADVFLVFMTDGSRSHADAMKGEELSLIRRDEALRAADTLGVSPDSVIFLNLPETRLANHRDEAIRYVEDVLRRLNCDEVYVPSTLEPLLWSPDHNITTAVVFEALSRVGQRPEVFEYLVWFWYHWPWVPIHRGADVRRMLQLSWNSRFGIPLWNGLNAFVPVADVLSQKRAALDEYRSQMTRLRRDRPWPVLSDVGEGDFLERFFQRSEFFRTYTFSNAARIGKT